MGKRFITLALVLFMAAFLASCSIFSGSGSSNSYHPQKHRKQKVKDCGCEVIYSQPKIFHIA